MIDLEFEVFEIRVILTHGTQRHFKANDKMKCIR